MTPTAPPPRRGVRRILVIVAVVLVVCCAGAVAAGFGIVKWFNSDAGPAQASTEAFLGALEQGRPEAAYRLLCPQNTAHLSQQSFVNLVNAAPRLRGHRIVGTSVSVVNGQHSALVSTELTSDGGVHQRHVVPLVRDGGTWYVCGEPY